MFKRLKLAISLGLSCYFSLSYADTKPEAFFDYTWGRGLSVSQNHLTIGGYMNASLDHQTAQPTNLTLNNLSLFITLSPIDSIRFFSEIELDNWTSLQKNRRAKDAFKVERLYVDFLATESLTVRVGKFLTPFGYWNVVHAAPLVWTVTRPLANSYQSFPTHSNGVMLSEALTFGEHSLDMSVYVEDSTHLEPRDDKVEFKHAAGARLHLELFEQLQLGFSYLAFNKRSVENRAVNHLMGADMLWKKNNFELQMEVNYRYARDEQGHEMQFYVQGVAPLGGNVFAVARYEHLQGRHEIENEEMWKRNTAHLGVLGLAWKPYTPLIFKAEYRFGDNNERIAPSGFFSSVSMLF